MTILSPESQKVKDAVLALYANQSQIQEWGWRLDCPTVVVALRAVADYLRNSYANEELVDSPDDFLYDIAAELESDSIENYGGNTPIVPDETMKELLKNGVKK